MPSDTSSLDRRLWQCFVAAALIGSAVLVARSLWFGFDLLRPIPFWDQWEFIKAIPHIYDRTYSISDLFAQHNEHRLMTSRLIFIIDLLYFDGSSYFSIFMLYTILFVMALFISSTFCITKIDKICVFSITLGFFLSLSQWENLSSGFQVQFPLVDLCIILSLICLIQAIDKQSNFHGLILLFFASIFDFLAVFSMASGVLIIIPAVFIGVLLGPKSKLFAAYIVLHLIFCGFFFLGYVRPTYIPATYEPVLLIRFAVLYLGACLRGQTYGPLLLGIIDAALFAFVAVQMVLRAYQGSRRLDRVQVLSVAMLLLLLCGAFVTANGRASLGVETATSSRYSLQSILVQILLFTYYWRSADLSDFTARTVSLQKAGLVAVVLALSGLSNLSEDALFEWKDRVNTYDTAGFAFASGVFSDDYLKMVYPVPALIAEPIRFLADHRLSLFSPRFGGRFRPPLNAIAALDPDTTPNCRAQFGATRVGPGWFQLEGWIFDPSKPAADGWVMVLDKTDQDRLVGFGRQSVFRPDVDEALKITAGQTGFMIGLNSPTFTTQSADHQFTALLIPMKRSQAVCHATIEPTPGG